MPGRRRRAAGPRPRWLTVLLAAGAAMAVLLVVSLAVGRHVATVAADLEMARDLIDQADAELEAGEIRPATEHLAMAQALLTQTNTDLHTSPELDLVDWLPVVGDNLVALRDAVGHALSLVTGGHRLLQVAEPLTSDAGTLEVPLAGGSIPLPTVRAAVEEADALLRALPGEGERPGGLLLGPVREAQDAVYGEAVEQRVHLQGLVRGLALLSELAGAGGDRRYLIAVANTAEMRGTGGMILSYGVLESSNGRFDLSAFGGIDELYLEEAVDPAALQVPADELARWEGREPTRLWRSVNLIPDLGVVAPRMVAMYEAATGLEADGVIQIDPAGLAAIIEGIGPVEVQTVGTVDAVNVVDLTLNQAYTLFPDRDQRQEVLGDVAEAVFQRLVDGQYDSLRPLGTALARTAEQRHLQLWTASGTSRSAAAYFGADGALPPPDAEALLLTVQNFGKDKLDYYVDTDVVVRGERPVGATGRLEVTVEVTNGAPPDQDEPAYVFGDPDFRDGGEPLGTYVGIVSLYVPTGTSLASAPSDAHLTAEGARTLLTYPLAVAAGERDVLTVTLELPARAAGPYQLTLVPQARVRSTSFDVEVDAGAGVMIRPAAPLLVTEVLEP